MNYTNKAVEAVVVTIITQLLLVEQLNYTGITMFRRVLRFGQFLILFHSMSQFEKVVISNNLAGFGASSGI